VGFWFVEVFVNSFIDDLADIGDNIQISTHFHTVQLCGRMMLTINGDYLPMQHHPVDLDI
jgi:hypothetical protein